MTRGVTRLLQGLSATAGRCLSARSVQESCLRCTSVLGSRLGDIGSAGAFRIPQTSQQQFLSFTSFALQGDLMLMSATNLRRQPEAFEGELEDAEFEDDEYIDYDEGAALGSDLLSMYMGDADDDLDEWEDADALDEDSQMEEDEGTLDPPPLPGIQAGQVHTKL